MLLKNVVEKTECDELFTNVNNISTTDTSDLVKKTDYKAKINEIENKITSDYHKCITTQEFNKLTSENFAAGLAQANLGSKADIPDVTDFAKKKKKKNRF